MIFTTLFTLLVGAMEAIQPATAGVLARTTIKLYSFQRRQTTGPPSIPPGCTTVCDPITPLIESFAIGNCTPTDCCVATFETAYFNCLTCAEAAANVTDYTADQEVIDELYDDCAGIGIRLPVLTFPGQNTTRPLSSLVLPSQTTVSVAPSQTSQTSVQTTIGSSTTAVSLTSSPTQATTTTGTTGTTGTTSTTSTPTPSTTSSFGIRSTEINLFTVAVMMGTWFSFGL